MNGAKPPRGGEYMTMNLVLNLDSSKFNPILVYAEEGKIVRELIEAGVKTIHLPLTGRITGIMHEAGNST